MDDVIRIIRGSENRADARTNLVDYFTGKTVTVIEGKANARKPASLKGVVPSQLTHPFDAVQADAILELQLHRLTRLSIDEILKETGRSSRDASPSTNPFSPARRSCAA